MRRLIIALALFLLAQTASADWAADKASWETKMTAFAGQHCAAVIALTPPTYCLQCSYYDAIWVYYQIMEYTGDTATWQPCIDEWIFQYRDRYVLPNDGGVPGYWRFTRGLRKHYEETGDASSYQAVKRLSDHGAYCSPTSILNGASASFSREMAYCLMAQMDAEALGMAQQSFRDTLVTMVLDHVDQWFITKDYRCESTALCDGNAAAVGKYMIQPFMVGITVRALIQFWDRTGDARVQPAVTAALDALWDTYIANDKAMFYINWKTSPADPAWEISTPGAPTLNMMIAPGYEWLYQRTSTQAYRDKADLLFQGAMAGDGENVPPGAYLDDSKQFNQVYLWSPSYIAWRSTAGTPSITTVSPLPGGTVGVAYSQQIAVTGGTLPYTACDETAGSLPAGDPAFASTANASGCLITGTPTGAGVSTFTERVTDSAAATDSVAFSLTISASGNPEILTTTVPDGIVDVAYSAAINCSAGTPPYTFTVQAGALCTGTSLAAATGVISGTPTTVQSCSYTIRCTDSLDAFDDQALTGSVMPSGSLTAVASAGSTSVVIRYGYPGLASESDCQVSVEGQAFGDTVLSTSGASRRTAEFTGLTSSRAYTAHISCTDPEVAVQTAFTTSAASVGDRTVRFSLRAASVLTGVARVTVDCDDNVALASPASVQNTSCGSGCTVNQTLSSGISYCRHRWQNSSDTVLATSSVQPVAVN